MTNYFGDGTVPTWSALMSAMKWSWEFDNNVPNAKPVKTVEACSYYNQKDVMYDLYDETSGA